MEFSAPTRYALAVAAVTIGVLLRATLLQPLGERLIFLTLYPAVMAAAVLGGFGPGVMAAVLAGTAVAFAWVHPGAVFRGDALDWLGIAGFLLSSIAIAALAEWSRRLHRRLGERTQLIAATSTGLHEEVRKHEGTHARLQQSEERLRLAASADGVVLYEQDAALRYTWIHSQDPEHARALSRTDAEMLPGTDGEALMQRKQEVLARGVSQRVEVRVQRAGGVKYFETLITPRRDGGGQTVGVAGVALDVTERRLRDQTRQLLASIVEYSQDAILALDLVGTITSWNRGAVRLFGYSPEEAIGRSVTMLIPTERHDEEPRILERIRTGERIEHYETRRVRKDGTELEISLAVSPLRNDRGEIVGASKIARDVTSRNRMDRNRRFLAALYDQLATREDADDIVRIASERTGAFLGVQRCCFSEWHGATGEIVAGHEWQAADLPRRAGTHKLCEFGAADWPRRLAAGLAVTDIERDPAMALAVHDYRALGVRAFATSGLVRKAPWVVLLIVAVDRPRVWREDELQLLENVAERVWPLVERARSEEALRASEQQLRLITDHAPVSLAQVDRDRRLKFVNQTYARRLGHEPRELIGRPVADVIGRAAYERILPHLDAALAGRHVEFETEVLLPAAGRIWVHVVYTPEVMPDGEVVGVIALITDVTARKEAEREVALARDHALAAARAKDDFLAALSHELRTPLNPVLLIASEAAENTALPGEVRRDFATIRKNVELEARLIDDLLDVTRITHGKLPLEVRPVDSELVLHDALSVIRPDAEQKRIMITTDLAAGRTTVLGDAVRLQQVFWNVLKNAVKFTPAGGRITVASENPEGRDCVRVTVRDNGIGMTASELERVFDAFAQGDHAASINLHRFGGLGLGLTISRLLVEQHHGSIRAESGGRGQGALFTIELPVVAQSAERAGLTDGSSSLRAGRGEDRLARTRGRVLLVEDHAPTRDALASLLRRRRYEVLTAGSIAEARLHLSAGGIGLLVSDIGLPDGDGCELMNEVRDKPDLRGIALTGYGMDADLARSSKAGFFAHLTKPIRVQALDAVLAAVDAAAVDLVQ